MYSTLSTLYTTTEVPLSKAPNPQLLNGHCSNMAAHCSGCVFTMCVHLDGLNAEHKFRVWVAYLVGHMSFHFHFPFYVNIKNNGSSQYHVLFSVQYQNKLKAL